MAASMARLLLGRGVGALPNMVGPVLGAGVVSPAPALFPLRAFPVAAAAVSSSLRLFAAEAQAKALEVPAAAVASPPAAKVFELIADGKAKEAEAMLQAKANDNMRRLKKVLSDQGLVELMGKDMGENYEDEPELEFRSSGTIKFALEPAKLEKLKAAWLKASDNDTAWVNAMAAKAKRFADGIDLPDWASLEQMYGDNAEWRMFVAQMRKEADDMQQQLAKMDAPLPNIDWDAPEMKSSPFADVIAALRKDVEAAEPDYALMKKNYLKMKEEQAKEEKFRSELTKSMQEGQDKADKLFEEKLAQLAEQADIYKNIDNETLEDTFKRRPELKEKIDGEIKDFNWF